MDTSNDQKEILNCSVCSKVFSNKYNLKRHQKRIHELGIFVKPNLCQYCGSTFTTSDNLERHIFHIHKSKASRRKRNNDIKCPLCDYVNNRKLLLDHISNTHNVDVSIEQLSFTDYNAFERWRIDFEKRTTSNYIKSHTKKEKSKTTHFYRCHRDGFHKSKANRIRNLKTSGSNKINGHCPARIDVIVRENKDILVNLMKTHLGHDMEIRRLSLTKTEKQSITEQLLLKVPLDTIVKNMKTKYTSERFQLLTKKTLFNIAHKLNLKTVNDSTLKEWVEENRQAVRYFKQHGESDSTYGLSDKDFLLVVMNDVQKNLIKKFGKRFICIDRLNKTNAHLGLFVFLEDAQELLLCTLVFANRVDFSVTKVAFEVIKNICGEIKSEIFMCDVCDSVQFYKAWCDVNPPANYYLFCPWRVEESFKTNVIKSVENKTLRSEVLKSFCSLLKQKNVVEFDTKFRELLLLIKSSVCLYKFQQYFIKAFENNPHCWAGCYVPELEQKLEQIVKANGNYKYDQSKVKSVKQIDGVADILMKFNRDKLFSSSGSNVGEVFNASELHVLSQSLNDVSIEQEDNKWQLENCVIEKLGIQCNCAVRCPYCHICRHAFVCSCCESSINWNMCVHIHRIGTYLKNNQDADDNHQDVCEDGDEKTAKLCLDSFNFVRQKQNLNIENEVMEGILKNELISEFSKEIGDLKTKEEYEVVKKLISFVGPALDAVRQNQASLNSLTLYF